jgi:hypothetical protein
MMDSLSTEQRAELYETRESLLAEGATRDEIRESTDMLLTGWGIDRP